MDAKIFVGKGIKLVGALGVGTVVSDIIKKNITEPESKFEKVLVVVGVFVIGMVVTGAICKEFDTVVDGLLQIE